MTQLPRLTDLVPRRIVTLGLLFLLGVAAIAAVEGLFLAQPALGAHLDGQRIAAFDLSKGRNLGSWLSVFFLQVAALVSGVNYLIRRNRIDDYQGHYRIWLWAALCWLFMSIDEGAYLHQGFHLAMVSLTGTRLVGDGSVWWVLAYLLLLVPIGLRLVLDMRECRLSVGLMVGVALLYLFSAAVHLTWVPLKVTAVQHTMIEEGAELLGHWLLVFALLVHARHLVFDVEGLLPERTAKVRPAARPVAAENAEEEPEDADDGFQPPIIRPGGRKAAAPSGDGDGQEEVTFQVIDEPHPVPKPAAAKAAPAAAAPVVRAPASKSVTPAKAPSPPGKWGSGSSAPAPAPAPSADGKDLDEGGAQQKLTKAERKALRQRLEQMRRQREAQGG